MAPLSGGRRLGAGGILLGVLVTAAIAVFVCQWLLAPPVSASNYGAPSAAVPGYQFSESISDTNIQTGDTITLTFKLRRMAGQAGHGGITVSFPGLDQANSGGSSSSYDSADGSVSTRSYTNGTSKVYYFPAGYSPIHNEDGSQGTAGYLIVESDDTDWPYQDYRTLELDVTPKAPGSFQIYYRFWLCGDQYNDCARGPGSNRVDQQGWDVGVYTVDVTSPSSDDFARNSAEEFDTLEAAENETPTGIWSDETTMWVADSSDDKIYAYSMATKARVSSRDFDTLDAAENERPEGIWSDGTTMWVVDSSDDKIYAYSMATKARVSSKDFDTLEAADNENPTGIWSDETTMWVADSSDDKIYAYSMATKARVSSRDFDTLDAAENERPEGIWSDGTTMWVVDSSDDKIYAYSIATKARVSSKDFDTLEVADNENPEGIWSDGTTMWVADSSDDKIYAYNAPGMAPVTSTHAPSVSRVTPSSASVSLYVLGSQTFEASASDPDDNLTSWDWSVNGTSENSGRFGFWPVYNSPTGTVAKSFSHTFSASGSYTVEATFTDKDGESDSVSWTVSVTNRRPTASLVSPETPLSLNTGDSQTFEASGSDPDNNLKSYEWFVNSTSEDSGTWGTLFSPTPTGTVAKRFSHTFSASGSYTVTATFTDTEGSSDSVSWAVEVANPNRAPSASRVTPSSASVSLYVLGSQTFEASASDPDDNLSSWDWSVNGTSEDSGRFGIWPVYNSPTGTVAKSFSHTFSASGSYTVEATFTDKDGESDSVSWTVSVTNRPPTASLVSPETPLSLNTGDSQTFEASGSDPDNNLKSYEWFVNSTSEDSGTWGTLFSPTPTGTVAKRFSHTFSASGSYTVTATFTDTEGSSDSVSWMVEVASTNRAPSVSPVSPSSPVSLETGDSRTFEASSSDPDDNLTSWEWSVNNVPKDSGRFGFWPVYNSPTGTVTKMFSHTFLTSGRHTVKATFTDKDGESGSVSWEVEVTGEDRTIFSTLGVQVAATCEISPDQITPGQNITFTSTVTGLETPLSSDINIYMKPTIAEAVRGIDASDEVPFKTDVASIGEGDEVTLTYQGATLYPGIYDFGCRLYWELPGDIPDKELTGQPPTTHVSVGGYGQFYGRTDKSKLTECKAANPAPLAGQSVELRTHGFWRQGDVARYFSGRVYVSHGGEVVENFFGFLEFQLFQAGGLRTLAKKNYTFDSPGVYTMDCELYSHPSAYPPSDPFASLTDKIKAGLAAYFSPASVTGGLQSFRGVMTNTFTVVEARWGDDQVSVSPNPLPQSGGTITVQVHTEESTTKQTAVPAPMFSIEDLSESNTAGTCGHDDLSGYTRRCWEAIFTIPENDSFESISYEVAVSSGQITGPRKGSFAVAPLPPPSVDRPALVALYNATGGDNWAVRTKWLSNDPVGEWDGVTTDVERGRVTRLDLLGNGLSGEIPVELGSLSNLEFLDLGVNRLRGNIPTQLGNLTSLLWLELTDNQLSGNIPPSLGRLTKLEILDLGENKLTGSIPPELGSMTNLDSLHLNDNELSGGIPPELAGLANLESLRLDGNRLTGCIPQGLRGTDSNDLARLGLPFCDVLLSGLTINPGTLTPQFQSSHPDYTAEVGQLRITVTAANDHNAAIQFLDETDVGIPDADGALDGHQVDLGHGDTTIKVKVTSQDNGASHTYTIRVTTVGLPGAPAITGPITPGAASLTVSWTAPPGGTVITSYDLRYIESSAVDKADANWTVVEDAWTTGSLIYTIEGLTGGAQYDLQIRAVTSVGAGPWSATSSGVPQATPGAPAIGLLTPGDSALTVEWSAPATDGGSDVTGYDLRYIRSDAPDKADANWTVESSIWSSGALQYDLGGLTNGVEYDVQVRAVNVSGTGPWSETFTGTPATWWALRSLSPESVDTGGEVEVTITAAGYGALGGQVVETLPDGFSYVGSDLAEEAVAVADQEVTFTLFGTGPTTFTYTVTASSEEGEYSFSGVLRNEDSEEQPVGGASTIVVTTDTAPEFPAAETGERSVLEKTPEGWNVGAPVAATDANDDTLTYTLGGADAGSFDIVGSTGQIKVGAGTTLDPAIRDTYRVVVTATGASGASADITVSIMVVGLLTQYDSDSDGAISKNEAIAAVVDYFAGRLTKGQTIGIIVLYFTSSG